MKKILLMLLLAVMFISCNKENEDVVEKTTLTVESQIKEYIPWGSDHSYDGINIKEGKSSVWQIIPINGIEGFAYVEGYEYELSVYKTTLSNPPMDGSNIKYKLIEVLQQNKD